jgi:hypothetical protein
MRVLRLVGIGAAALVREWILVTVAAAAGRHRVALLQACIAAAAHSGSCIGPAIVDRTRRRSRRRHRDKGKREQRGGGRGSDRQKLLHSFSLSVGLFQVQPRSGNEMARIASPST